MERNPKERTEWQFEPTTDVGRLVQRALDGEMRAFDLLVRRFEDMAVGYGAASLGDFHLAQDVAQEAFLETFRVLAALRNPDAFPVYLRLTIRKHCDRMTRCKRIVTVSLDDVVRVASRDTLCETVMDRDLQTYVRDTVRALPEPERDVVVLFYIGMRSLKEVASFLDVPVSTVKNRLHAARRRLRERMAGAMEETQLIDAVQEQRPSQNHRFRGQAISRLYSEYVRQFHEDSLSADRSLLDRAGEELKRALADGSPDTETVHAAMRLLMWTREFGAFAEWMQAYLQQPLSPSERFWARWTRIRGLAMRREAEAVVRDQRELMEWVGSTVPGDPPIRLTLQDPFEPTDDRSASVIPEDALTLFALGIEEIGICYHEAGVFDEWVAQVKHTVQSAPKSNGNRLWRFYQLRNAVDLLTRWRKPGEAMVLIEWIRALADDENDWQAPRWPIEALLLTMRLHAETNDQADVRKTGMEAIALLSAYHAQSDGKSAERSRVLRILANNLAAPLTMSGNYDLAQPLWEQLASDGLDSEWSYGWYAECIWVTTHDKARAANMLRHAAACRYDAELQDWFLMEAKGFQDVREDADFLAALS